MTNGTSVSGEKTNRRTNASLSVQSLGKVSASEEMKFQFHKHRSTAQVKVPLATPEVIELNEQINSSANTQMTESLTDSAKQTEGGLSRIESSVDSSSDSSHNPPAAATAAVPTVGLQRKVSDRKIKRVRAKPLENTGTASSNEILKKREEREKTKSMDSMSPMILAGSDDDILLDDDKYNQKKKRRPSFKRRKKYFNDQTQTDSGIDSRMGNRLTEYCTRHDSSRPDSKDSNKLNITPEPSSSSNVIVSNEEDSSAGDGPKDSKVRETERERMTRETPVAFQNASVEELEERPTANWIRRQLQNFAQARREVNFKGLISVFVHCFDLEK